MKKELTLKVLLALPDRNLSSAIEAALQKSGFDVLIAPTSTEAMRQVNLEKPEFVIMDRMIPDTGGIRLCKSIRAVTDLSETRIIMLSNSSDVGERILALDSGSDDYLVKPFEMEELMARLAALQRRHPTARVSQILKAGTIEMVPEQWVVNVGGDPVKLTEKEYRLLLELLQVKGRVLSRESLLERVWGHQKSFNLETRTVDVHMSRLRNKLGSSASNIITVRNIGYRINISPEWLDH